MAGCKSKQIENEKANFLKLRRVGQGESLIPLRGKDPQDFGFCAPFSLLLICENYVPHRPEPVLAKKEKKAQKMRR